MNLFLQSHSVYLDQSYVILRGASNDPDTGANVPCSPTYDPEAYL